MKRLWSIDELVDHCTLLPNELALLGNKTGPTRLGFAVLLKTFQLDGRFPTAKRAIPPAVITSIAKQIHVSAQAFRAYDWQGRSISNHRTQIREFLGVREWTLQDDTDVGAWLALQALTTDHTVETLMVVVYTRCRELHLEPPTAPRLERVIRSALDTAENRLWDQIVQRLPDTVRQRLDALLERSQRAPSIPHHRMCWRPSQQPMRPQWPSHSWDQTPA